MNQSIDDNSLGYRAWLDGLRGVAILCVVVFHLNHSVYDGRPMIGDYVGLPQGYLGVDIFFVLSGFLITSLLLEEWARSGSISLKRFYMRRALRLLPALIVFLGVMVLFALFTMPEPAAIQVYRTSLYALFYSVNWVSALSLDSVALSLAHTWSLSIEEQFYLLWPLLLWALLRFEIGRRKIVGLVVAGIVLIVAHRLILFSGSTTVARVYAGTDTRADSLLIGCVCAMLITWRMLPEARWFRTINGVLAFAGIIVIELYLTAHMPGTLKSLTSVFNLGFTIFGLSVAALLVYLMTTPPQIAMRILENRPLVWIGRVSYSLYLWHLFAVVIARAIGPSSPHAVALLSVAIAMLIAAATYYWIELPFLRLKSRFAAGQTRADDQSLAARHLCDVPSYHT